MKIELKFFASVREALGCAEESLELPPGVQTVAQLRAFLCQRGGVWEQALGPQRLLRTAYNHQMCEDGQLLSPSCEVAFFPPVTGG